MGVIATYTCPACGYRAEVHEGGGFFAENELRVCRATGDLVAVTTAVHRHGDCEPPPEIAVGACPDCGGADLAEPARIGIRRRVACPRCGEATRRATAGLWD